MASPLSVEVASLIDRLLTGMVDRESASQWAAERMELGVDDPVVEEALGLLVVVDAWQTDADGNPIGYMYDLAPLVAIRNALAKGDAGHL